MLPDGEAAWALFDSQPAAEQTDPWRLYHRPWSGVCWGWRLRRLPSRRRLPRSVTRAGSGVPIRVWPGHGEAGVALPGSGSRLPLM